jgi:EAL domain-containing protein (putative c-di-GMP-specific phosphodiesterase class I)
MESSLQGAVAAPSGKRGRILLVDDDEALLRAMKRAMTAAGYDVATASDGRRATDLLAKVTFDAIVSDIDMPRMDGIELLRAVRRRDLDLPVILITGAPQLKTAIEAIAHGALQYLTKPIDLALLGKAVARAVALNKVAKLKREALILVRRGGLGADHHALGASFELALETLWMAYQPIVRVSDRSLFGYEALLRSEVKALPCPGDVLDAAERLGQVHDLGRKVRAAVAAAIPGTPGPSVFFVNLHAHDLMDETLLARDSPLSAFADRVVLEITERESLEGVKDARQKVADLRAMGFRIAIDDLGAGYAGLTSFATLEPEFVKLDMALIRDVDTSSTKEKLVRSMTSLCKDLGMMVVAEGVETLAERDMLVDIGCDLLQGYVLAMPGKRSPVFAW